MIELTPKEQEARKRVCLALDVPTTQDALGLSEELAGYVGMFKVGKQLHTAAGNEGVPIVRKIFHRKGAVFLDLKYHDTPNTVYGAARASAVPGVSFFNVHLAGGEDMCKKAKGGAYQGAQDFGIERPLVIGVTELTSLDDDDLAIQGLRISYDDLVRRRTELAREWGLDGIVCPASKAGALEKEFGSDFMFVTPGIKWAGKAGKGQKQIYTPDRAVQDCTNSTLVIGSAISKAKDRVGTTYEILQAMAQYL
jgi:orotidine-5'-phosphate decarboxylase